jgi:hypothetical protein
VIRLAATALALATLTACGSSGDDTEASTSTASTMTVQQVAAKVGCQHWHNDSEQMYTSRAGHCDGVPGLYEVASFNNTEARDNWLSAAAGAGGIYVYDGLWVVAAHTPEAAKAAQAKVGGTIQ